MLHTVSSTGKQQSLQQQTGSHFHEMLGTKMLRAKERKKERINWNSKDSIPKSYIWSYKCNNLPPLYVTETQEQSQELGSEARLGTIVQKKQLFCRSQSSNKEQAES